MTDKPKYEIIDYKGQKARLYENGVIKDANGRFLAPPPSAVMITAENANDYHRMRQEKARQLLRERITEAHNSNMPVRVQDGAEAFAESGAMLYEQVVLDSEKYPRDRLEAWEKLGKYSQVLPDKAQSEAKESAEDSYLRSFVADLAAIARAIPDKDE